MRTERQRELTKKIKTCEINLDVLASNEPKDPESVEWTIWRGAFYEHEDDLCAAREELRALAGTVTDCSLDSALLQEGA